MGAAGSIVIETEKVTEAHAKTLLGDEYDEMKFIEEATKYEDQMDDEGAAFLTKAQAEAYLKACAAKAASAEAEEGEKEDAGKETAGTSKSVLAGELKKGMIIMDDVGKVVMITHLDFGETGKHGHAKVHIAAANVFHPTDGTCRIVRDTSTSVICPIVTRKQWKIMGVVGDPGQFGVHTACLMDDDGNEKKERFDDPMKEYGAFVQTLTAAGARLAASDKDCYCFVTSCKSADNGEGKEQITSVSWRDPEGPPVTAAELAALE